MPKFRPLNISLSPNTERDDVLLAAKLLRSPRRLTYGHGVARLEEKIRELIPAKHAYAFRSGRSALYAALEAINIGAGDEVLLQTFTCAAVPNAVQWAGGLPIYVDIDEDTFNISVRDLEKKITAKSKAIIVQHTFGAPAELKKIAGLAKKHNLFLIEDCALSLGAKYDGRKVGAFGAISIFSFGRDKVISGVSGGMATTNDPELAARIAKIQSRSKMPNPAWTIRQLLHPILMNKLILPTYNMAQIGKLSLEALKAIKIIPMAVHKSEKLGEKEESMLGLMPNALAVLALHQMKKLDKFNEHRAKIVRIYNQELASLKSKKFVLPKEVPGAIWLRYNIKTPDAKAILKAARAKNIILGDWYRPSIAPPGVSFAKMKYDPDTCPVAEHISRESINLPTGINIKEADAIKIASFIKEFYADASKEK